jgi:hypothetical protein
VQLHVGREKNARPALEPDFLPLLAGRAASVARDKGALSLIDTQVEPLVDGGRVRLGVAQAKAREIR